MVRRKWIRWLGPVWRVAELFDTLYGYWQLAPAWIRSAVMLGIGLFGGTLLAWVAVAAELIMRQWFPVALVVAATTVIVFGLYQALQWRALRKSATYDDGPPLMGVSSPLAGVARQIKPLLDDNWEIFNRFGPNAGASDVGPVRFDMTLWERAKRERIVPNNDRIEAILSERRDDIPVLYRTVIEKMRAHIYAFSAHVADPLFDYSEHRFPQEFRELIDRAVFVADVSDWLQERLLRSRLSLETAMLFGSLLQEGSSCRDVDLVLFFDRRGRRECLAIADWTGGIKRDFQDKFARELDITAFTANEREDFDKFLERAGEHSPLTRRVRPKGGLVHDGARHSLSGADIL